MPNLQRSNEARLFGAIHHLSLLLRKMFRWRNPKERGEYVTARGSGKRPIENAITLDFKTKRLNSLLTFLVIWPPR